MPCVTLLEDRLLHGQAWQRECIRPIPDEIRSGYEQCERPPPGPTMPGRHLKCSPDRENKRAQIRKKHKQRQPSALTCRFAEHDPQSQERDEANPWVTKPASPCNHVRRNSGDASSDRDDDDDGDSGCHSETPFILARAEEPSARSIPAAVPQSRGDMVFTASCF